MTDPIARVEALIAEERRRHAEWERAHAAEYEETLRQRDLLQSTLRWRAAHGWYWFWYCYWPLVLAIGVLAAAVGLLVVVAGRVL